MRMENYNHLESIIRDKNESIESLQTLIDVQKKVIKNLQILLNSGLGELEKFEDENQASF